MKALVWRAVGLLALAAMPALGSAQAYPDKPIKLIVTWPPGGSADAIGRLVAGALTAGLGQTVYVENAAGASGNIGTQQFTRAQPDGHTLLLATSTTNAASPALFTKIGFHPVDDFVPISPVALAPSILIVPANSAYKSPKDIVAAAKAQPAKLTYGSGGNGNSGHLSAELFRSVVKIEAQHVPYKGNSPAMVDLIGGQIDFMFDNGAVSMILGGKVRGLSVAGERRLAAVPDIPTFAELGWPGVQLSTWFGLAAPKGTPAAVVNKLNAAVTTALQKPDVAKRLQDMGAEVKTSTPAAFATFWKSEIDRYRELVKLSGAKIE
ncbi:tripartite tricarboxylate transporter substrate binding protein [Aquincola sp. S2]|uniref:Tripartite tricarboxylate transporter substrate binding protein n=1 Tax=Pseudaquabacterium terrae TaxID=2732868 RepID=A0ABX2EGS2_9BURK|nr:tripartite tricarboxylate transporter substrate binding protein [Aquabacterium terrae]NRF67781.1 tripartite tricarboxylate transporter substrate binding protein [Aquabacterium terrae]